MRDWIYCDMKKTRHWNWIHKIKYVVLIIKKDSFCFITGTRSLNHIKTFVVSGNILFQMYDNLRWSYWNQSVYTSFNLFARKLIRQPL